MWSLSEGPSFRVTYHSDVDGGLKTALRTQLRALNSLFNMSFELTRLRNTGFWSFKSDKYRSKRHRLVQL